MPTLFEVNPVPERDVRLNARRGSEQYPGDELANSVVVGPLAAGGCQAVQHRRLGLFEVQEGQDALRCLVARGDLAYEFSNSELLFDLQNGEREAASPSSVLRVWKKDGGQWKIAAMFACPHYQEAAPPNTK